MRTIVRRGIVYVGALALAAVAFGVSPAVAGRKLHAADRGAASHADTVAAPAPRRVALLPFTARGAPPEAWPLIGEALSRALPEAGFEIVSAEAVNAHLRARRLRDTSILTHDELAGLAAAVGADRVLLGYIFRCDGEPNPAVSLSGRLIGPERFDVEAMTVTVLEGRSLLGPMGSGGPVTLERVVAEAVRRFAASLASGGADAPDGDPYDLLRASVLAPDPTAYLAPRLSERGIRRIAVLPFRNESPRQGAGQAVAEIVSWCLMASGRISLVDAGDATGRLLLRGWRTGMPVGREEVLALGKDPGVDAVLMGSVERWVEGDPASGRPPEIAFAARLLDAGTGAILWAANHERRGDQTRIFYDIGNVRLAEALVARAAGEALQPLINAINTEKAPRPSSGDARK